MRQMEEEDKRATVRVPKVWPRASPHNGYTGPLPVFTKMKPPIPGIGMRNVLGIPRREVGIKARLNPVTQRSSNRDAALLNKYGIELPRRRAPLPSTTPPKTQDTNNREPFCGNLADAKSLHPRSIMDTPP